MVFGHFHSVMLTSLIKILTFETCFFSLDISVDVLSGVIPRWQASNHIQSLQSKYSGDLNKELVLYSDHGDLFNP